MGVMGGIRLIGLIRLMGLIRHIGLMGHIGHIRKMGLKIEDGHEGTDSTDKEAANHLTERMLAEDDTRRA